MELVEPSMDSAFLLGCRVHSIARSSPGMRAAEFEYKTALLRAAYSCYETLERRRWIKKPSTTTKSTPDTTWIRVTLFMAISFLVDFSPG
jgi:hypothetical protein